MVMVVLTKLKKVIFDINSNLENRAYRIATTVGIIVFALGVFSSYIYAGSLTSERARDMDSYQKDQANYVESHILTKLATYEELIIAGAVIHKMDTNVTKSDWRNIYYNLRIPERAPELLGYGYIEYVKGNSIQEYINKKSSGSDYMVTPSGDREDYAPVKYIEPLNDLNARALGYDMYTDSTRYDAMMIAKTSGEPALTGPLVAIQDQRDPESTQTQSLIMYYPVYEEGRAEVVNERTLVGYSYIIFRIDDIMQKLSLQGMDAISSLYIQDMAQDINEVMYSRDYRVELNDANTSKVYERELDVLSRKWTLGIVVKQPEVSSLLDPTRVFIRGVIISLMVGALLFLILLKRASDINRDHSINLQRTKDELLALASHQLRTPATGVRQYVGMLIHGYFGALDKDQLSIAKKAYDSNERQLEIIDQLLYVAKADAGQLLISFSAVDIAKITNDVIAGYANIAASKNISMYYKGRKKLLCSGDQRYLTMIIENLVSNAIKYSYPDSKVQLELKRVDENVVLRVKDRGVGIQEEDMDKLFQKFSRIESSLSRSEGGSGLGLFLAQKLAESHGGEIVARSRSKKGTAFTLTLPVRSTTQKSVVQLTV